MKSEIYTFFCSKRRPDPKRTLVQNIAMDYQVQNAVDKYRSKSEKTLTLAAAAA